MNHGASDASLAQCALFRAMLPSERQQLLNLMDAVEFAAGETILREGKSTQSLWVIVDGQCQVVKHTKHGIEQVLARLEMCSAFGEMSFFNPAPHSASVKSVTPVKLLCLPREKYDTLLQAGSTASQKLAINTIALLAERLRVMDEFTCDLVEKAEAGRHSEEWHDFRSKLYSEWQF